MDIAGAANYFNVLPLQGWDYRLTDDPWVTRGMPDGRLLIADREQSYGAAVRWRTLLVQAPVTHKAVRLLANKVFLLGLPDEDYDTARYSVSYPVYRADSWVKIYRIGSTAPAVGLATLAGKATRTLLNPGQDYPAGIDRVGTSQAMDTLLTDVVIVLPFILPVTVPGTPPVTEPVTAQDELDDGTYTYQVKEAYQANGMLVVRGVRKKKVVP